MKSLQEVTFDFLIEMRGANPSKQAHDLRSDHAIVRIGFMLCLIFNHKSSGVEFFYHCLEQTEPLIVAFEV
jgi:hypothetical protein